MVKEMNGPISPGDKLLQFFRLYKELVQAKHCEIGSLHLCLLHRYT